jgi:hypothetical protein
MTTAQADKTLSRLSGSLFHDKSLNLEPMDWRAVCEHLANDPRAKSDFDSLVEHFSQPAVTVAKLDEWFTAQMPDGIGRLELAREKTAEVVMACYEADGNWKEILWELTQNGCTGTSEFDYDQCLESLEANYHGNGLECSLEDFLNCEW